ncbi:glycosyltransferase [Xanthomarina gelatinilytica]|uniref:glycosyltransferase n=1 Tax=Xanthomarina gelatinilytica TaxID=1137281 RepID=UPI003AA872C0
MKNIISFTTIPSRINNIKPMVDSLLNQSVQADEIILWVSKSYKRLNQHIETDIPDFIKKTPIIVKFCEDVGPFTKLYYSLKQEWNNKECIIITVDDDVFYPKHWLKQLLKQENKTPNKAIGYRGRVLTDKLNYNTSVKITDAASRKPVKVDIITGTWGALYKVKFFDESIFNQDLIHANFMVDDIWITGNLAKNNIERIIIKNVGIKPDLNLFEVDSLWEHNKTSNNNNKMLAYFEGII